MRSRLTPAVADVRRAVRESLAPVAREYANSGTPATPEGQKSHIRDSRLVLVALSGGPDSLALAAATAFEAPRAGLRAGAVVVDHGLQAGSAAVSERAAAQARELGLDPVAVRAVTVGTAGGPEAAARAARYAALDAVADETGALAILLGHTLDDQAETVLLGLARGSGASSLQGWLRRAAGTSAPSWCPPRDDLRPPARTRISSRGTIRRTPTRRSPGSGSGARSCRSSSPSSARGIAEALARTAEQLREDASALDALTEEVAEDLAEHADGGISLPVAALAANPAALRHRLIRLAVSAEFGRSLSRAQTLEVARLVTDWHGQGPVDLPGVRAAREGGSIVFIADSGAVWTNRAPRTLRTAPGSRAD